MPSFCGAKTSAGLFTADILGGGGTDAAGYKPHDVCVSKLELTIVQGCTMVNDWHRMATERLPVDEYSVNEYNDALKA